MHNFMNELLMLLNIGPRIAPILTSGPLAHKLFDLLMNFHVFVEILGCLERLSTSGPTARKFLRALVYVTMFPEVVRNLGLVVTSGPFAFVHFS